ncbi:glycerol dehydrogenase [Pusillimonas sp. MFBS29]|uniref:glycerol dehydrogenase n=1 Tax=Pusillimonas sp. MFBS29 TaxID=2886690 RepID=UPI001D11A196|nr:glycerol dehydrogenase [Pusillimonas sp. MFBS29]MCC2594864.1 glycerol dehydrogenase [Pusillimonas sp. MFBS29]
MLRTFGAPHRYVQGPGAIVQLGELAASLGARQPLIIIDESIQDLLLPQVMQGLGKLADTAHCVDFSGECTRAEVERLARMAAQCGADLIVGVGGGKTIDSAKGVRIQCKLPLFIVPSIASNDSPTSRLVVLYTPDHAVDEVLRMPTNPDLVLVDTDILVKAPERFYISGVGDALSKKFEAAQCIASGKDNFYDGQATLLAQSVSGLCYDTVREHAERGLEAVRRRQVNDDFERTVEATILLSGLAFENAGLSIAHSLTRGLSAIPGPASALHGEQVAFGLLVQLLLEGRSSSFMNDLLSFYGRIGLPKTLTDLGLQGDPAAAAQLIAKITWERAPYIKAFTYPLDQERLAAAVLDAHQSNY